MFGKAFESLGKVAEDARLKFEQAAARSKAKLNERETRLCAILRAWRRMIAHWTNHSRSRAVQAWRANLNARKVAALTCLRLGNVALESVASQRINTGFYTWQEAVSLRRFKAKQRLVFNTMERLLSDQVRAIVTELEATHLTVESTTQQHALLVNSIQQEAAAVLTTHRQQAVAVLHAHQQESAAALKSHQQEAAEKTGCRIIRRLESVVLGQRRVQQAARFGLQEWGKQYREGTLAAANARVAALEAQVEAMAKDVAKASKVIAMLEQYGLAGDDL